MSPTDPLDVLVIGRGPVTVVALHGIQGTRASWLPIAQALSSPLRFVLPNLRGRGLAWRGSGPQDYTLEGYAAELDRVIEQSVPSGDPWVLAGWSLGVSVALAGLQRDVWCRPNALLLVSGTPCLAQARWFDGEGPVLAQKVVERRQRLGLREWADDPAVMATWAAIRHTDQRPLLPTVGMPARLLHGSADTDCPLWHAHDMAHGLGADLQVLDGVGHSVLVEAAPAVQTALLALCAPLSSEERS